MPIDLTTRWLGLELKNPLMPGASPLADDLGVVRRLEDAGAGAIVMKSLFEEQIRREQLGALRHLDAHEESHVEAISYFPPTTDVFGYGPEEYLEKLRGIRGAVSVPVIASLNGTTVGGWCDYAVGMQQAGASALELNLYELPTDPAEDAAAVEARMLEVVREVTARVTIPVAVKLSPFYSSLPSFVRKLEPAGARGVVLFNRLYQADIDIENLDVRRALALSNPSELLLRLRWLAIVRPGTKLSLACSGGVHSEGDALKALMAGADVVQMVSALLMHGPERLRQVLSAMREWLEVHEYTSVAQLKGSMSYAKCPDPSAYERGDYATILQSWHTPVWS